MINTKAIRDRILLLALKGELVEQKPQDTPASNLIDELCKKISDKSFEPDFSEDEVPYDVPSSWSWCRLSDIGSTNIGLTYHPEDVTENGVIVARSSNIVNGKMDYSDLVKVSCSIRENQYLNNNDILICARNGSKALVGKCAIYEGDSKTIAFGAFMAVFRTPLFRYVYYYFNTDVFKRNFISDDSKQINQVTQNILKQSLIPIPPLEEQERIVGRIEAIFEILDTIDVLQNQYASNQEALKSKLIDAGTRGKLTEQLVDDGNANDLYQQVQDEKNKLQKEGKIKKGKKLPEIADEDIPFEIPSNWKWVRLGSVLNEVIVPQRDKPKKFDGDIPWCRIEDADGDYMSKSHSNQNVSQKTVDEMNLRIFPVGTILSACSGGSIGRILITTTELCTNQTFNGLVCSMGLYNRYLFHFLRNSIGGLKKMGSGAAMEYVSQKKIGEMLIPLPPLTEQHRIVEKLDAMLSLTAYK